MYSPATAKYRPVDGVLPWLLRPCGVEMLVQDWYTEDVKVRPVLGTGFPQPFYNQMGNIRGIHLLRVQWWGAGGGGGREQGGSRAGAARFGASADSARAGDLSHQVFEGWNASDPCKNCPLPVIPDTPE